MALMAIGIPPEFDGDERFFFAQRFLKHDESGVAMNTHSAMHDSTESSELVIVGSGMAATRLVETLRRRGDRRSIAVLGAERALPYNRVLLSPLLAGEIDWQQLVSHPAEWYEQQDIALRLGHKVARIDRVAKRVECENGFRIGYGQLVFATGSGAAFPNLPGIDLPGVVAFREVGDATRLQQAASRGERIVVLGGGLLGLEAATAMAARGATVTLVHRAAQLMNRQLDNVAAGYLQKAIERRGVTVSTGRAPVAVRCAAEGEPRATGVVLDDGTLLPADLVIAATGIVPATELAAAAGLTVGNGICIDDRLRTSDPDVFALGECCEHRGATFGLVAPIWQQVEVLVANLCGEARDFRVEPYVTMLKVSGIDVHTMGAMTHDAGTQVLAFQDRGRGVYKKLLLREQRVVGALLFGDIDDSQLFFRLVQERRTIGSNHCRLLLAGELPAAVASA
jgi:nitrite reductase (NADH) large subunit